MYVSGQEALDKSKIKIQSYSGDGRGGREFTGSCKGRRPQGHSRFAYQLSAQEERVKECPDSQETGSVT